MIKIKKGISVKKCNKKKQVFHKILVGRHDSEFPGYDLVKFAKLGHYLVSVYTSSSSGSGMMIKDDSRFCSGFSIVKRVPVKGSISHRSLIEKVLKRLAKHCAAMAVILETNQENTHGSWISYAKYCADWFLGITATLVLIRISNLQLRGFRLKSGPGYYLDEKSTCLGYAEDEDVENSKSQSILISEYAWRDGGEESNYHSFDLNNEFKEDVSSTSITLVRKELPESSLVWPLLLRTCSLSHGVLSRRATARNKSVVEWVMSLPSRNLSVDWNETSTSPESEVDDSVHEEDNVEGNVQRKKIQAAGDESTDDSQNLEGESLNLSSRSLPSLARKLTQSKLGWPLLRVTVPQTQDSSTESEESKPSTVLHSMPANCKQFSYEELERATRQFSSENLIGEGGCSNVYKGCLPSGKLVAVKVLKSYQEAWNDFCLEVDITSSLKHKNITTLVGVCTEDSYLVLVYEFLPKGSLEEVLHGQGVKYVLPWEVRFKVAVAIAEALTYLHNECSSPVIHRDIKSSNILLSNELEPQLSDFGLAIRGPTDSSYTIHEDVAGTFGYIAPEYFMHGRLSGKIDVYSYGVVLLELLTGRKPIAFKNLEGQESLVKWAKPLLKTGEVEALLDPNLVDGYDSVQMQRMMVVANLCIDQWAHLRPKADKILRLLRGEGDATEWVKSHVEGSGNQEEEDDLLELSSKPSLDFSFLETVTDVDAASLNSFDTGSFSSAEQKHRLKLKDYLRQQQD